MELRQIRYFVRLAECLSFSEAARSLCITQSTLSQQIKQLENEFDTLLFERTSHSVALTEAGRELLPVARKAISAADDCRSRIDDLSDMKCGTLNIGVTYSFSPILTESIVTFMKMYPGIKLNVLYKPMSELMEALRRREVDFALAFRLLQPAEGVESHILFQSYLAAIVRPTHSLASHSRLSLHDLQPYDLALPARGLQARNAFDSVASYFTGMRVRIELNEVNILLRLIGQTDLVTILAEATIHNIAEVKAIPLDIPDNTMTGCVHLLTDSYRKRSMQEFLRILSDSVAVRERQNAWL